MIAEGATDVAIGKAVGVGRMSATRHRVNCVLAPAKALAEAAGKGREVAEQRAQVMAAAQAGDPMAFVALQAIVDDLRKVHDRLERQADAADKADERTAVTALSAQQLRAMEVRAKLGGAGGYATPKTADTGGVPFSLIMNFSGVPPQTITAMPVEPGAIPDVAERGNPFAVLTGITPTREAIEAPPDEPDDDDFEFENEDV
jgi:hypothetical protein